MHKAEYILENETHKTLLDFKMQTEHQKDHHMKIKENKKIDKHLDLAWERNNSMEHEGDDDTYHI